MAGELFFNVKSSNVGLLNNGSVTKFELSMSMTSSLSDDSIESKPWMIEFLASNLLAAVPVPLKNTCSDASLFHSIEL